MQQHSWRTQRPIALWAALIIQKPVCLLLRTRTGFWQRGLHLCPPPWSLYHLQPWTMMQNQLALSAAHTAPQEVGGSAVMGLFISPALSNHRNQYQGLVFEHGCCFVQDNFCFVSAKVVLITCTCGLLLITVAVLAYIKLWVVMKMKPDNRKKS